MNNKVISIQLDYLFDKYPTAAVHRPNGTNIYINISKPTWDRIINFRPFVKVKGIVDTNYLEITYR
jgi:hypothetical protein